MLPDKYAAKFTLLYVPDPALIPLSMLTPFANTKLLALNVVAVTVVDTRLPLVTLPARYAATLVLP